MIEWRCQCRVALKMDIRLKDEAPRQAAPLNVSCRLREARICRRRSGNAVYFSTSTTYRRIVFCDLSRGGAKSVHAFDL